MPTYEYLCSDCGKTFEAFQKITEDPLKDCPLCGGKNVKRLISATAFHLKGGGWYKTDYASPASGAGTKPAAETKTEAGSSEPAKAEAAKPEPAAPVPSSPTTKSD